MSANARGDLKYSGIVTIPGGSYDHVSLDGVVTIDGDMDSTDIKMNGVFKGIGKLKSNTVSLNGTATFEGIVEAVDISLNGDFNIRDSLKVDDIYAEGRLSVKGNIVSKKLNMHGIMKVSGSCEADNFDLRGTFTVGEMLNAEDINVDIYGPCGAKEIGCGKIIVRKGERNLIGILADLFSPLIYGKTHLTAETIEGDDINVEHTTAKVIRGNTVAIGNGCVVDLVEYRADFKKSAGARVMKHVKI